MKKILVPIDFSPASHNASEYASSLAKAFAAEIYLLHVFIDLIPASEAAVAWMITRSELQASKNALVNEEINFFKKKYSIKVGGYAMVGNKGDTIHNTAKEIKADLVVMGMKKEKKSKILGSTTLKAIRKLEIPVLVIPEEVPFAPLKHIMLATDFDEVTDVSHFHLLFKIVEKYDAMLQVFHVQRKGVEMAASEIPGKIQLGRLFSKVSFWYEEVEDDDIDHGVLHYIQNHPTDLLVIVAHRHNILEKIFGTLHTRPIIVNTVLPVLVIEDK